MPHGTYVVFDLETTGLDAQLEGIVEVAAVKIENGLEIGVYSRLVNPGVAISPASQAIHGISEEMVADAPPVSALFDEFLEFVGPHPLVAHNAPFDMHFLTRALLLAGRPALSNPVFDSLEMSRELFPEQRSHKLEAICRLLGYPGEGYHRALADARNLATIFPRLLSLYHQKRAWYRAQYDRIEHIARRYDMVNRLIDDLQAEQSEAKRVLGHYFTDHPGAHVVMPGGDHLAQTSKETWDYDTDALLPLLNEWGLRDKFLKLDRPRMERWLTGSRLTDEQKSRIAATRLLVGQSTRLTRVAAREADGANGSPAPDVLE